MSPLEAQSWLCNQMWTPGGTLRWKAPLRGVMGASRQPHNSSGVLAAILREVWLIPA